MQFAWFRLTLASPKSAIFKLPCLLIKRFAGFKSRCMIRCAWQYWSPRSNIHTYALVCASVRGPTRAVRASCACVRVGGVTSEHVVRTQRRVHVSVCHRAGYRSACCLSLSTFFSSPFPRRKRENVAMENILRVVLAGDSPCVCKTSCKSEVRHSNTSTMPLTFGNTSNSRTTFS